MSVVKKRDQLNIKKVAKNFNDNQAKLHFWGDISEKKVNLHFSKAAIMYIL